MIIGVIGATFPLVRLLADADSARTLASQWEEYAANVPKTIIELQPFRETTSVELPSSGGRAAATLINLNPRVNAWFLLSLQRSAGGRVSVYHLENPQPKVQALSVGASHPYGIRISVGGRDVDCELWRDETGGPLPQAQASGLPYAPLCEDRLYLRNPVSGTYTHLERVTNFLRDHVWGGEQIVGFVRKQFFADAFVERSGSAFAPETRIPSTSGPPPARSKRRIRAARRARTSGHRRGTGCGRGLMMGQWYAARGTDGIFLSVVQPQALAAAGSCRRPHAAGELDAVEGAALDYMVALDLAQFDLGFAIGTDHPRVGWSERTLESMRDPKLPGPDGIGSVAPLVVNGMVNPPTVERVAATFAGGFKREHGAFHYGALRSATRAPITGSSSKEWCSASCSRTWRLCSSRMTVPWA